jgi:hypothetical protein
MSIVEKDMNDMELTVSQNETTKGGELTNIKEELTPEGLYFKKEDGSQGFIKRAENENYWGFTEDEILQRNRWVREAMADFPNAEEGMVEFLMSFYMKFPDKYHEIIEKGKGKRSRHDSMEDLRKKYVEVDNYNNKVFDIVDDDCASIFENNQLNLDMSNVFIKNE